MKEPGAIKGLPFKVSGGGKKTPKVSGSRRVKVGKEAPRTKRVRVGKAR